MVANAWGAGAVELVGGHRVDWLVEEAAAAGRNWTLVGTELGNAGSTAEAVELYQRPVTRYQEPS